MNRAERRRKKKEHSSKEHFQIALSSVINYLSAGRPKRALQILQRELKKTPSDVTCLHYLGIAKYKIGDIEGAQTAFNEAIRLEPSYAEAHNSLGNLYLERTDYENAIHHFEKAVSLNTEYANAYTNLAEAHQKSGSLELASQNYSRSIEIDSSNVRPYYSLATALIGLNRPIEAQELIERCLLIDPWCQNAIAASIIVSQMLGDLSGLERLQSFGSFVRPLRIEIPEEYQTENDFNAALAANIRREESLSWEPLNRVTHQGAVTEDLLNKPTKLIRLFEMSLRSSIDAFLNGLEFDEGHPFLNRAPKNYTLTFVASILKAGGWHPPHIHENAWLSGVYYVDIPDFIQNTSEPVDKNSKLQSHDISGHIEFGRPNYTLPDGFEPVTYPYQPESGVALCFPSYFFHKTVPFAGSGERIGIAFDVYPDS